jgi:hypothetical protein
MRAASVCTILLGLAGCDMSKLTVNTTSKVLVRAQPAMKMEADYELARLAIPGSLKTVEGFWMVDSTNPRLIRILTEGYCQYGTAFVEDDWEAAKFANNVEEVAYHNDRSTKIFTRCLNYALLNLGERWQKEIFEGPEVVAKLLADTTIHCRFSLLFAGIALGSLVNHNLTRIEMLGYLPTVEAILNRVIELDKERPPADKAHAALPHIALGMLHTGRAKAVGGNPELGKKHFEMAIALTEGKFLLPRALMALRVGKANNDRTFFHDQLAMVLETAPSVWPEQRLANEVAHRKARRYLRHEKQLF